MMRDHSRLGIGVPEAVERVGVPRQFKTTGRKGGDGEVFEKSLGNGAISGFPLPWRDRAGPFRSCRSRTG
jgi:hypothetical protein